jgi:hypothetical protein
VIVRFVDIGGIIVHHYLNFFPLGSNIKQNPAVAAILNFIPEQKM